MRSAISRRAYVLGLTLSTLVFTSFVCPLKSCLLQKQPSSSQYAKDFRLHHPSLDLRDVPGTDWQLHLQRTLGGDPARTPGFEDNLWDVKHIADMVRDDPELNRASEMSLPLPWEPLRYSQGSRYAPQWNDAANSYRSLVVDGFAGTSEKTRYSDRNKTDLSSRPPHFALCRKRLSETGEWPGER